MRKNDPPGEPVKPHKGPDIDTSLTAETLPG
jgi:hypothetical protein